MHNLSVLILSFFIVSCAPKKQQAPYVSDFPREITISEYETLPIDVLNPTQIFASSKYIAVLMRHEEKMIWVYDRQSHEHIASFISEGRGPDEVLVMNKIGQADPAGGNLKIKVQSFPEFVGWLDVDASIQENKTVFTDKIEFGGGHRSANFIYAANDIYYLPDNRKLLMFMDPERSGNKLKNPSPFSVICD